MKPQPGMMPLTNAHPDIWKNFKPNTDLKTGQRVIEMLNGAGIETEGDDQFDWMIDSEIALVGMFGDKCPPTVIISQNAYWDPWFHARIGTAIRSLRQEGYLIIGSGGGTHNLYRTEWHYALKYRDVFAMESPPDPTNLEFRQALQDVICKNGGGPELKRGLCRLMKHPYFRDAHGTDEHYVSACFVAGAIGEPEDRGAKGVLGAEVWELVCLSYTSPRRSAKNVMNSEASANLNSPSEHGRWLQSSRYEGWWALQISCFQSFAVAGVAFDSSLSMTQTVLDHLTII
jgi:aromatic ring-opening dioxygenase catalytic subunit (LigB family)